MKRFFSVVICFVVILSLSSCGNTESQNIFDFPDESGAPEEIQLLPESHDDEVIDFETIQALYPDKTILVWTYEKSMYQPPRTNEVNEYLDSIGCDYAVCFLPIENYLRGSGYSVGVRERISNGEQVDIIFSDIDYVWEHGVFSYYRDYFDGLYICLDDYLFNTEHGKELYAAFPEKHWDTLKINDSIYAVDGSLRSISLNYGYLYNQELVEKYDYDIATPPSQQIDKLLEISRSERIIPFYLYDNLATTAEYTNSKWLAHGVVFDETRKCAISVLEDAEYLDNIREVYTLLQNDLASSDYRNNFFAIREYSYVNLENGVPIESIYAKKTLSLLPQMKNEPVMQCPNFVTGISVSSEHPGEAFHLLSLCLTDAYLSDLLTYGAEGKDYNIVDGYADNSRNVISIPAYVNRLLSTPNSFENGTKTSREQYEETLKLATVQDTQGFVFDASDFDAENYSVYLVLKNMSQEAFSVPNLNFEEFIEEYKHLLVEAGIQKIIDEANRQYELFKNKKTKGDVKNE